MEAWIKYLFVAVIIIIAVIAGYEGYKHFFGKGITGNYAILPKTP